uniref:Uncharacterized protein n=1 Tax=Leersia perrieri TaxID=77586 RepID=A0A0D9VXC1_9ORYZ
MAPARRTNVDEIYECLKPEPKRAEILKDGLKASTIMHLGERNVFIALLVAAFPRLQHGKLRSKAMHASFASTTQYMEMYVAVMSKGQT